MPGNAPVCDRGQRGAAGALQRFLTLKRLRAYLFILAVTIWSIWLVDMSRPGVLDRLGKVKGTDFIQFYVSGAMVREGRKDLLYDAAENYARAQALAGTSRDILYLPMQTPIVSAAFAALASFTYTQALWIWFALIAAMYALSCWVMWRSTPALHAFPRETLVACVAFPGLFSTILHGQLSAPALLAVTAAYAALRRDRTFVAGLALGCLAFKTHWAVVAAGFFLVAREWRVVAGIVVSGAAQFGVMAALMGGALVRGYWDAIINLQKVQVPLERRPVNSLKGLSDVIIPFPRIAFVTYCAAALVAVLFGAAVWRRKAPLDVRFAAAVLTMILVSPHAFEYDLILLVPVFFLLVNRFADPSAAATHPAVIAALVALFLSPLFIGIPSIFRLQFSVTAMGVILIAVWRSSEPPQAVVPLHF